MSHDFPPDFPRTYPVEPGGAGIGIAEDIPPYSLHRFIGLVLGFTFIFLLKY